ncbi:MAG: Gfo/Idh/MocA family oxidoreductase [Candidatus Muirbacterium halophilum]|nr:Gfo/Idh/MocA family oxidoreductase [Candidatus Muirbacterium halophilum]MCK9474751.1 Gfo/Idh/MocA family oxidoreductase [Candidatus Muirbacterium halophilum]
MLNKIKYKTAICGIGRIAYSLEKDPLRTKPASHIGAIKNNDLMKISEVCDISGFRLEDFYKNEQSQNIDFYFDYKKMAYKSDCNIAVIATDSFSHVDIIKYFVENMKNLKSIVCEKPLSLDYISAKSIENILINKKISFYVNHTRRWNINYLKVKNIIDKGKLGKLTQIVGFINAGGQKYMGEGPILHDGTHLIDMVLFFTGEFPEQVFSDVITENNIEKCVNVFFKTQNNIDVYMNLSSDKKYFFYEIELYFEFGKVIIGNQRFDIYKAETSKSFTGFVELSKVDDMSVFDFPIYNNRNFFDILYNEVCHDIKNKKINLHSYYETLKVQKMIHCILKEVKKE